MRTTLPIAAMLAALALPLALAAPAHALSSKECGAKWQTAKADGSAGTQKYADFRKAQCGSGASPAAAAPAATTTTRVPNPTAANAPPPSAPRAPAAPSTAPSSTAATYPSAVNAKYASESAGKARMHTCLDQYNANKATGGNGGLTWIAKGGGYYSECNRRLKG